MGLTRGIGLAIGVWGLAAAGPAAAQENLDQGKTPAQLFASDCAICHKTTQGLSKAGGALGGLQNFLREHYTASKESAAAIAAYVTATDKGPAPAKRAGATKRASKGDKSDKSEAKAGEKKPENKSENKPETEKSGDATSSETKSSETKSSDAKSSDAKSGESGPAEAKSSKSKPAEAKAGEPKASGAKPDNEPDAKSGDKVKSD